MIEEISLPVDIDDDKAMYRLIHSSIGTKFVSRWSDLMCDLALTAVRTVSLTANGGKQEVDIKRYARVEKVPGGEIEDSKVLDGVMLNKDITHPRMRRRIENPRIILLDCPLEYKKGESQTNIEISKENDWNKILEIEEEQVKRMCDSILALKPDLVITEKGVSGKLVCVPSIWNFLLTGRRSGTAFLCQAQRDSHSTCPEDRQQPYRPCYWCHDRQPCRRYPGIRHRNPLRPL